MLIRVRTNVGVWRVDGLDDATATVNDVLAKIATTRPNVQYETPLCSDPGCKNNLEADSTLAAQGFSHGAMVHCRVDASTTVSVLTEDAPAAGEAPTAHVGPLRRVVDKDGQIKLVPATESQQTNDKGFRKGMLALRDMKMSWTLAEFSALDSQFEFKMQRQEKAVCTQASLDIASISNFQAYCQRFQFKRKRAAYLYGKFVKAHEDDMVPTKTIVEAIYEPPQDIDPEAAEGFVLQDDPLEDRVDEIAEMLGLRKVGWILGHEAREPGLVLTNAEVIMAGELQLEAAGGIEDTPFVTVVVKPGEDGLVAVEAFQVSKQCMEMVAEEALEVNVENLKVCNVNETFTAIQEGKPSPTVENDFFICVVPIVQHNSETFVADFPRLNRELDDRTPSHDALKRELSKAGSAGWTFVDRLADFNLLLYLSQFLDVDADFAKICASVVDRSVELNDGYKLIIKSLAGLEGSY
uniref:Nuclear pore localisation protein NPL4 C-terminal domain-containing protein n=1 Tax=Amphora coffeiformis TaxID=265554 RepID=A0A7S3LCW4_9STRA|mmetsp:Transcript_822/g.1582  ORF Transcript_822/g.1582 Transcript_822/m.1582 type:complete len:466 (+) Transcript_822:104-1501(+)|eukprot:scaffold17426_cov170-Amphora_coffeaeformis.AAC.4